MLIWLLESFPTSSEGASSRPMTYDEFSAFRKAKEHERQGHFKNAGSRKKKKATVSVSDNLYCLLLYHITFNYRQYDTYNKHIMHIMHITFSQPIFPHSSYPQCALIVICFGAIYLLKLLYGHN